MKIALFFCVVAVVAASSCFATALPPCVSYCVQKCQGPDLSCLKTELSNNVQGTVKTLVALLCAFDRYVVTKDVGPLTNAIQNLASLPSCATANIQPNIIYNGGLQSLLQTTFGYVTVLSGYTNVECPCGSLFDLLGRTSSLLSAAPVPGGIKNVLTTVTTASSGLLDGLLETVKRLLQALGGNSLGLPGTLLGPNGLTSTVTGFVPNLLVPIIGGQNGGSSSGAGILNGVTSTINNLVPNILAPLTGQNGGSSSATGILNGVTSTINNLVPNILAPLTGQNGGSSSATGILNGVTSTINNLVPNILAPLTGQNGGSGLLTGILNGVTSTVSNLGPNILAPLTGQNGGSSPIGGIVNGLTSTINNLAPITGQNWGSGASTGLSNVPNLGLPLLGSQGGYNDGSSNIQTGTTGLTYGNLQQNSGSALGASVDIGFGGPAAGYNGASLGANGGFMINFPQSGNSLNPTSFQSTMTGK
ncbi:uncharacterized transmembrane protein DDB_G0289901-like isoform X2 [Xenopus tropicalis]|uniref:Uncharacterized transmembrane protein DDB_G0289901-like isoform X2 n=1 Tax=Xenopus tropicalis TaxID=8364 RepID=A0A8J1J7Z7_XENTR|nr:uncharacterized transmembrane protein DDB_G0289901-like isoform X2 [Xenopus tropicalis]